MTKRVLIITQAVDIQDQVLGFFVEWLREFAGQTQTNILSLFKGTVPSDLASIVYSLEKEKGSSQFRRLSLLYRHLWKLRNEYDTVFVHMNPIYVILGWPLFFLGRKKITLWYTHKHVDWKLRIATALAHTIYSASKESFRLETKKLIITGHGIDVDGKFAFASAQGRRGVVSISRFSPTKQIGLIVSAYAQKVARLGGHPLTIFGSPITALDREYKLEVEKARDALTESQKSQILFHGACSHDTVPEILAQAKVFINMSNTGSMDKAILEACARGCLVVSTNEAFKDILGDWYCSGGKESDIATLLARACNLSDVEYERVASSNRTYVETKHSLSKLIRSLVDTF
jgi:glycosyltransferase involved in cell wall biosynthesis